MAIHPLAVVDPKAEVHEEASVGPFCVVGAGVRLERGVELRNHATVYGRATIGEGSILFPGCVVGSDPQDLKYRGEDSEVRIGKQSRIHECVTISKGTAGGGMVTEIGDQCLVMAYAHIAHDCRVSDSVVIGNQSQLAGHVRVGRRAVISGMVGLHHFVTVGELAFVAGMSGVRTDVPPYVTVEGYPAEPRSLNIVGLRRDRWAEDDIRAAKDAFRALWHDRNGHTVAEVVERLRAAPIGQRPPVQRLCDWMSQQIEVSIKGRLQEAYREH